MGLADASPSGRLTTYVHELECMRAGGDRALALPSSGRRWPRSPAWLHKVLAFFFFFSRGAHNETAQALYEWLGGDRKPLGDVDYWWDLD